MALKKFGDLQVGDVILGPNGEEVTITQAYDAHMPERMFEIELENGESIKASGNHLWYVETKFDYEYHRERRREAKKLLKTVLTSEMLDNLREIAISDDDIETSLTDMVNLLEAGDNRPIQYILERVARSIGHVSENTVTYQDMEMSDVDSEDLTYDVRHYDASVFCQQVLSLTGQRKYKKQYPLVVGSVVTTLELMDLYQVEIPVLNFEENKTQVRKN